MTLPTQPSIPLSTPRSNEPWNASMRFGKRVRSAPTAHPAVGRCPEPCAKGPLERLRRAFLVRQAVPPISRVGPPFAVPDSAKRVHRHCLARWPTHDETIGRAAPTHSSHPGSPLLLSTTGEARPSAGPRQKQKRQNRLRAASGREGLDIYWLILVWGRLRPAGPEAHEPETPRDWKDLRLSSEGRADRLVVDLPAKAACHPGVVFSVDPHHGAAVPVGGSGVKDKLQLPPPRLSLTKAQATQLRVIDADKTQSDRRQCGEME